MLHGLPRRLAILLCLCGIAFSAEKSGVWLDVPFVKQQKDGCGSAVIAMVMQYWRKQQGQPAAPDSDPETIQRVLFSRKAHGIYSSDLEGYLRKHAFQTFTLKGTWEDLRSQLEKGRPLIVALKPAAGESSLHYVVVTGLDWGRDLVLVNDPAQKKLLQMERRAFEKEWAAVGRWTLLALPH